VEEEEEEEEEEELAQPWPLALGSLGKQVLNRGQLLPLVLPLEEEEEELAQPWPLALGSLRKQVLNRGQLPLALPLEFQDSIILHESSSFGQTTVTLSL